MVEHPELHPDPMTVDANGPEVARQGPPVLDPPDPHAKGGGPPKDDVWVENSDQPATSNTAQIS
ncbi:hypothetical protein K3U96_26205 [Mycolicibacterium holsaticum DSM 44478 = JCM 12374]|nr:hypothetical protein [Mycolicibacterium holsaticum]QZA15574.1 hypothetical protein K3U96_26205 [Mycolicibacterium holsaticum DSM 44478 = JCM 12374]